MRVDTCGFLLYHRNRELHALFIIGLNCQDKKKRFTRFHLYDKLQTDKKSFNSPHDVINNNSKDFDYERKTINHQASTNV